MNGKELAKLRVNKELTQKQLADEIGVKQQAVARWETTGTISKVYQKILTEYFKK
jgi:transcriptional regulator with XRE-family HTH domain